MLEFSVSRTMFLLGSEDCLLMGTVISFKKTQRLQNIRLRDNLIHLMKQHNTNMTHIYKETGVPITTIQRICKNPAANPTLASLIPIADFFSITLAQLIGEDPLPNAKPTKNSAMRWSHVPIISWEQATHWPELSFTDANCPHVATELMVTEKSFALKVADDHLENFHRGSIIIIDTQLTPSNRDYIIVHKSGSAHATLKQVLLHENDTYLKPLNSDFKTTLMDESYTVLGVIIQVRMNLK